jgi:Flp pilus assembly pilin Flp
MKTLLLQAWSEEEGVLSFEWVLLITLLVIGIVGGLAAARDGIIDELGDIAEATMSIDQSFSLPGIPLLGIPDVEFEDEMELYEDCERATAPVGQGTQDDGPS